MSKSTLSSMMLLKATLFGCGLLGVAVCPLVWAQDTEAPAADAAETDPSDDPGGLFVNPDGEQDTPAHVQVDLDTTELNLDAITEIAPDVTRSRYRLSVERPAMLTLMLDAPQGARVSVRDADGQLLVNQATNFANDPFQQNIRIDRIGPADAALLQSQMFALAEAGDYVVQVQLPAGLEGPAHLGAGVMLYPEGVDGDAGVQEEPAQPVDTPPEQTPVLPAAAWQAAELPPETSILWFKIEPEQTGLHTVIVRAAGRADIQLWMYQDGRFADELASVDQDPFNQPGNETILFSAVQGQTYYLKLYNRRDGGGGVSVYLLPLPEELPQAQPRDPDAEDAERVPESEPAIPDAAAPAAEPARGQ